MRWFLTIIALTLSLLASVMANQTPPGGYIELVALGENCHIQFHEYEDGGGKCTLLSPAIGRVDHKTNTCKSLYGTAESDLVMTCRSEFRMAFKGKYKGAVRFAMFGEPILAFPLGVNIGCRTYFDTDKPGDSDIYMQEGCEMAPRVSNQSGQFWYKR